MEHTKFSDEVSREDAYRMLGVSKPIALEMHKYVSVEGFSEHNYEEMWGAPTEKRVLQEVALKVDLVFSSEEDSPGGKGAKTLYLCGLDENYNIQGEIITPQGTSFMMSHHKYLRILHLEAFGEAGGPTTCGYVAARINGHVQAYIAPGDARSQMSHFTVPAGHTAFVSRDSMISTEAHIVRKTRSPSTGREITTDTSKSTEIFTEKTDFWLEAKASTSNSWLDLEETITLVGDK